MALSPEFQKKLFSSVCFLLLSSISFCAISGQTSSLPSRQDSVLATRKDSVRTASKDSVMAGQQDSVTGRQDSATTEKQITRDDLIIGERLFHGLVYTDKTLKCSGCHTVYSESIADTMNWNPNALEISLKYLNRSVNDLSSVLLSPSGVKMSQVHAKFKFTPDEVRQIKAFMDQFPEKGLRQKKPVITNLLLFIIASVLLLASLTDILVTKKLKKRWINGAVAGVTTIYITWELVVNAIAIGRSQGFSPDQPIKFSHAVHAGQNQTDCIYCHNYAPYSKVSGIPSGSVCMNCHLLVRNGTRSGMFEIAKVIDAYDNKRPVHWVQVYNLPDHVYFNHSQHFNAGGVDCLVCHGPVPQMDRIVQHSDLSMGWCINCHRTRKVNFNENAFYTQYKSLSEKVRNGQLDSVTVAGQGGTECMRCHY